MDFAHPPAEVETSVELVQALLLEQLPALAGQRVRRVGEGWDNVTFRVGSDHAVRLPRREKSVELLLHEQRWLPLLGSRLSLAVPSVEFEGAPSADFPWPWSVVAWIDGAPPGTRALSEEDASRLAADLRALHVEAPAEAPCNPFRGVPLAARDEPVRERIARMQLGDFEALWDDALAVDVSDRRVFLHGDLHPRNLIVRGGALVGLIDWGDLTAGDPATDLAAGWMSFGPEAREVFLDRYAPTEEEWVRARGWAVNFGMALIDSGDDDHVEIGRVILERIKAE